jgi:hypothetical protein
VRLFLAQARDRAWEEVHGYSEGISDKKKLAFMLEKCTEHYYKLVDATVIAKVGEKGV